MNLFPRHTRRHSPLPGEGLGVRLLSLLLLLASCKEDNVNNKYCNFQAQLTIENIMGTTLHTACENGGEFCSITSNGQQLIFTDASNHSKSINIPAEFYYHKYNLGLSSGYIVGRPSIPEIGDDTPRVICYDRACSNCYQNYNITKPLVLQVGGYANCNSCGRTYNLNDCGIVSDGPAGRLLYRYRVYYYPSPTYTLEIKN